MKWVESKQQNSTSLPKAAFPAGRPPWAFPRQVPADHSCWALRRSKPGPPVRGSPVLRALWVGGSEAVLGAQRPGGPACPAGVPISPEKWGERGPGPLLSVGGSVGTVAGWTLQRGFPADSGGGARLSLEESRRKEHQGQAPGPGFLWPLVPTRWFLGSLSLTR